MREIKFRGKEPNGRWVYGYLHRYDNDNHFSGGDCHKAWILEPMNPDRDNWSMNDTLWNIEVDPDSVGQYTGLKDKNGKEIYEGDIVKFVGGTCYCLSCGIYHDQVIDKGELLIVKKLDSGHTLSRLSLIYETMPNLVGHVNNYNFWTHQRSLEIIGNIYENSNLLENDV